MNYPSIRLEGSILCSDLLDAIAREDKHSQKAADFGLPPSVKVKDEIATAWASAKTLWATYQPRVNKLAESNSGTSETRNLFILPLLSLIGYEPENANAETLNGKSYAISHRDKSRDGFPIHIMGWRDSLERKRTSGGPRMSSHALVQEYINLTEHLYALVTNGQQLRLLRDSSRLIKLSYLEFDLVRMFEEDLYADFAILFRLLHASRMPASQADIAEAVIEKYHQDSLDSGSRIRDGLSEAVAFAMQAIANGLLQHPDSSNQELVNSLRKNPTRADDLHQNLLRWVYRTLFLLVIEERGLNHAPNATARQCRIYRDYYSLQRLRRLADRPRLANPRSHDLWLAMHQTLRLYEGDGKGAPLGIDPLGSFLFEEHGLQNLFQYQLDNRSFLTALNRLSTFTHPDTKVRMRVNYGALDVEEFGSVYEMLLELSPRVVSDGESVTFSYAQLAGSERKTSGSYYTPDSLVQCLLDSALDPVIDERLANAKTPEEKEAALLAIKVCDPAVGSGHFLMGAAHRLARRLAEIRSGDEALSPETQRQALREVVSHCLYGVDINPLSVELCKVSLWMLGMEPGKPLSFLDHHIQCGNSLLGTTPALLKKGIPDDAFKPIEGDNKAYCTQFKKANKEEAKNIKGEQQGTLFDREQNPLKNQRALGTQITAIDSMADDSVEDIAEKQRRYVEAVTDADYLSGKFLADLWCAAFVWKKCKPEDGGFDYPITNDIYHRTERNPNDCPPWMSKEIQRLSGQYQFFHWHLAFPDVFVLPEETGKAENEQTGWNAGFDVMLGNPPWETLEFKEKEWFASISPDIANAPSTAKRRALIAGLENEDTELFSKYQDDLRNAEGIRGLIRHTNRYPLCAVGKINTYSIFAEANRQLTALRGRVGCIVQSGIASDDTTKHFFDDLMSTGTLARLLDFENSEGLFPGVHREQKFSLLTMLGSRPKDRTGVEFAFFQTNLADIERSTFELSADDIARINPNTKTCPIFRRVDDAILAKHLYTRLPILVREAEANQPSEWVVGFRQGLFNMSSASGNFVDLGSENTAVDQLLPIYEGKLTDQFDHRCATFQSVSADDVSKGNPRASRIEELCSPDFQIVPRFFLKRDYLDEVDEPAHNHFLTFHRVANPNNERSAMFTIVPRFGISDSLFLIQGLGALDNLVFCSLGNSFAFDYITRLKVGSRNFSFFTIKQIAVPIASAVSQWAKDFFPQRVLELTYTAWDLEAFALDCGYDGPPFRWGEERRFLMQCELDAAYFHLYLGAAEAWGADNPKLREIFPTPRDAVDYIMETFPIVKRKDIARTEIKDDKGKVTTEGTYLTKDTILSIYDEMQQAIDTGQPYQTRLDPPPGPPTNDSGNFTPVANWGNDWPHHIHLPKDALAGGRTEFRLSDLRSGMPEGGFEVLPDDLGSTDRIQLERTHPDELKTGDVIAVAHPEITCQGNHVGVALGELRLNEQMDADTGEAQLLAVIKDSRGLAQLKLSPNDWAAWDQVARVVN